MWRIEEHRRLDRQLSGRVPIEVLKRYEKWKDIVRLSGPAGLLAIKGFRDEALSAVSRLPGFESTAAESRLNRCAKRGQAPFPRRAPAAADSGRRLPSQVFESRVASSGP